MNKSIERRLAAAERRLKPRVPVVQEIIIRGGLPGATEPAFASIGDLRCYRGEAESFNAFRDRVVEAATAAGERFAVFGGLRKPDTF